MVVEDISSANGLKFGDDAETASWWRVVEEAVIAIQEARKANDGATREDLYRCVESFNGFVLLDSVVPITEEVFEAVYRQTGHALVAEQLNFRQLLTRDK